MTNNSPFNNALECGLRALVLLQSNAPNSFDLDKLMYLDYIMVNSGDFDSSIKSLHAPIPTRKTGLYSRRITLRLGVKFLITYDLALPHVTPNGIQYKATANAPSFLEKLTEQYTHLLIKRAKWVTQTYGTNTSQDLSQTIRQSSEQFQQLIAFEER